MRVWNFLTAHWGELSAAALLVLKWVYNAWTPGVPFPEFIRIFIGEIVQEAPQKQQRSGLIASDKPVPVTITKSQPTQ